ncbi:MAG: 4Fe-4S binding protein [Verrucomicrobia bacterium]|jgi:coenzyme F420 hydrogenase subunit beta|nr:4Fe-4S binding protein [Verrucomicrobiota bacterium]
MNEIKQQKQGEQVQGRPKRGYADLEKEVIDLGLCARCGICSGVCPVDVISHNARGYPELTGECIQCGRCVDTCPGADVDFPALSRELFGKEYDPDSTWGEQRRVVVGHPSDDTVRKNGASGGLTTALLLYLLKTGKIEGAGVVGMDPEYPSRPKAILATTEEELRAAAKSKYTIVPSMEVLSEMRKRKGPFAVVALPCQIHGLRKMVKTDPALAGKVKYILGLYCHYNMEPDGHLDCLRALGIDPDEIAVFEFRGGGWPGGFRAVMKNGEEKQLHHINIKNIMTVMLRLYGSKRCYMCTDALCEFGDVGLGDFWAIDYDDEFGDCSWSTMASERTDVGRELLESAERDGWIEIRDIPPDRYSRRTENFTREKKTEGFVRLRRFDRQNRPRPDFHFEVPSVSLKGHLMAMTYASFGVFRQPKLRAMALRILFSPFGSLLDRLNTWRKEVFLKFGGN